MIFLKSLLTESIKKISLQQAIDEEMFGPVYHGTDAEKRDKIAMDGFKIPIGNERNGDITNGYESSNYSGGIPAPIHHLGFGVYFTTVKSIAKKYNGDTTRGLKPYFLNSKNKEVINFASPNTMMKWWLKNGYDYNKNPETTYGNPDTNIKKIQEERLRATLHMTEYLKSKYDIVWFKGKGLYRLLDGDEVVVFDTSIIYEMDKYLIKPGEVGSVVVAIHDIHPNNNGNITVKAGTKGIISKKYKPNELQKWAEGSNYVYHVKFEKGGKQYNILDKDIEPYVKK